GKIERFHGTLKRWLTKQPLARTIAELQAQLDTFAEHFNNDRRSSAGGELTPTERHHATIAATPEREPITPRAPEPNITITAPADVHTDVGHVPSDQRRRCPVRSHHEIRGSVVTRRVSPDRFPFDERPDEGEDDADSGNPARDSTRCASSRSHDVRRTQVVATS